MGKGMGRTPYDDVVSFSGGCPSWVWRFRMSMSVAVASQWQWLFEEGGKEGLPFIILHIGNDVLHESIGVVHVACHGVAPLLVALLECLFVHRVFRQDRAHISERFTHGASISVHHGAQGRSTLFHLFLGCSAEVVLCLVESCVHAVAPMLEHDGDSDTNEDTIEEYGDEGDTP